MSKTINYLCMIVLVVLLFGMLGCGSDPDATPRPIKSSKTCCEK